MKSGRQYGIGAENLAGTLTRRGLLAAGAAAIAGTSAAHTPDNTTWQARKRFADVGGVRVAYIEAGVGPPIVLLHGNPTSSYLWRHVIPHLSGLGRCIAPDLLGMGDSDRLAESGPGVYTYERNIAAIEGLLDVLDARRAVTLVLHDWGSAIGLDIASRFPERIRAIVHMEAILRPSGDGLRSRDTGGEFFALLRSPQGEHLVLQENMFIEKVLLGGLDLYLTDADRAEYRRPFVRAGEDRRPTLEWPRELPLDGTPARNDARILAYTRWLQTSAVPKLFIRAMPGAIFANPGMLSLARSFPNQQEVSVYGGHFMQEVSGDAIGRATARYIHMLRDIRS